MGQPNPPADPGATPPAPITEPATTTHATGDGLGDAGKKALDALRAEVKELQKQNKELQGRDPLKELLAKLGAEPGKGEDPATALQARISAMEERAARAELAAARAEVAAEKGLTPKQAARLQGSTREELEADADDLLASFPAQTGGQQGQQSGPRTPAPDPSQGARGAGISDLRTRITEAEKAGNQRLAIRLKAELQSQLDNR